MLDLHYIGLMQGTAWPLYTVYRTAEAENRKEMIENSSGYTCASDAKIVWSSKFPSFEDFANFESLFWKFERNL